MAPIAASATHRTRRASASVGAQIHCARTRMAHTPNIAAVKTIISLEERTL